MNATPWCGNRTPERLTGICMALPEATVEPVEGEKHLIFRVRNRAFAYYLHDHHGDGEVAAYCKVEFGMNEALSRADPTRFFLPAYLAHLGWVSVRLDRDDTDWDEVAHLVEISYRLAASPSLARKLDDATLQNRRGEATTSPRLIRH